MKKILKGVLENKIAALLIAVIVVAGVAASVAVINSNKTNNAETQVVGIEDDTTPLADSVKEPETKDEVKPETPATETPVELSEEVPFVKEGYDLINGNFADGINGFEFYSLVSDNAYYEINNGIDITIFDTGSEDWHVQLKQNNVRLVQGNWYRLTLQAKSTVNRTIGCSFMHDGTNDDNWTGYSENARFNLTNAWQTYSIVFQMSNPTDNAVFNLALGTVDGRHITTEHTVSINNIALENLGANFTDTMKLNGNLIGNGDFSFKNILWESVIVAPGRATASFEGNKATFNITNPGSEDWNVQLKQSGIVLEKDQCYRLTFDASSTVARNIKIGFMDTNYVNWYGGGEAEVTSEKQTVTLEFQNTIASDANAVFMLSMGKLEGVNTPASTITLENISLVKIDALSGSGVIKKFHDGWQLYDHEAKHVKDAYYSVADGFVVEVADPGKETWHIQLTNRPIALYGGKTYKFAFDGKASIRRNISAMIQHDGEFNGDDRWDSYTTDNRTELTTEWQRFEKIFTMPYDDTATIANFSLGYDKTDYLTWFDYIGVNTVYIKNLSVVEIEVPTKTATGYIVKKTNATTTDQYGTKWVVNIDLKEYGYSGDPVGKDIVATAKVKSSAPFVGVLGGCYKTESNPYEWAYSDLYPDENNECEVRLLIKNYSAGLQFQISSMEGDSVEISDIKVRAAVAEDYLVKDPFDGFSHYAEASAQASATFVPNSKDEMVITVENGGEQRYHVQLQKPEINLVKGNSYRVTFDAKSTIDRDVDIAFQKNGGDYSTYYSEIKKLTADYQTITVEFTMANTTDEKSIFNLCLGNVPGQKKFDKHTVTVKNFVFEDLGVSKEVYPEKIENGYRISKEVKQVTESEKLMWQLKFEDYFNECNNYKNKNVKVTATLSSDGDAIVQLGGCYLDPTEPDKWPWNGSGEINLKKDEPLTRELVFDSNVYKGGLQVQITSMSGTYVDITDVKFTVAEENENNNGSEGNDPFENAGLYLADWDDVGAKAEAKDTTADGVKEIVITNPGTETWHVHYCINGLKLEEGKTYQVSYDIMSNKDRAVQHSFKVSGDENYKPNWYIELNKDEWKHVTETFKMDKASEENATFKLMLGDNAANGGVYGPNTVSIKNFELVEDPYADYYLDAIGDTGASIDNITFDKTSKTFTIKNAGTAEWNVILQKTGITLEKGKAYNVSFKVKSSVDRSAAAILQTVKKNDNNEDVYTNHYYKGLNLEADTWAEVNDSFFMYDETEDAVIFQMNFGKFADEELAEHEISIKDLSVKEASAGFVNELDGNEYEFFAVGSSAAKREFSFPEFEGKKVKVSAKVTSDNNNFGGCMGYSLLGKWTQDERGGYADGESFIEWSTTIDVFSGSFELQLWWNSFPVIVSEVTVTELENNSQASTDYKGFYLNVNDNGAKATNTVAADHDTVSIESVGTANYHLQLQKAGLSLEKGHWYSVEFDVISNVDRYIQYMIQEPVNYDACDAEWELQLRANETKHVKREFKMEMDSADNYNLNLSLGKHSSDGDLGEHTVTISNFVFEEINEPKNDSEAMFPGSFTLVHDGDNVKAFAPQEYWEKHVIITVKVSESTEGSNGCIQSSYNGINEQFKYSGDGVWTADVETFGCYFQIQMWWGSATFTDVDVTLVEEEPNVAMFMLLSDELESDEALSGDDEEIVVKELDDEDGDDDEEDYDEEDAMLPEKDEESEKDLEGNNDIYVNDDDVIVPENAAEVEGEEEEEEIVILVEE